jgi:hypothetical protein
MSKITNCSAAFVVLTALFFTTAGCQSGRYQAASPAEKIELFNGRDFDGWLLFIGEGDADPGTVWSVSDGVIYCTGKPRGYIRTKTNWCNYKLHVEWRWPEKPGNSGILFHATGPDKLWPMCFECQLADGKAGDLKALRGTDFKEATDRVKRKVPRKAPSSERPAGQWNTAEIYCRDDTFRLFINDVFQNEGSEISHSSGSICLQSEGRPIDFRNIYVEPLTEK